MKTGGIGWLRINPLTNSRTHGQARGHVARRIDNPQSVFTCFSVSVGCEKPEESTLEIIRSIRDDRPG